MKHIENNIREALFLKSEYDFEHYIREFELQFAEYNKSKYVIALNSGTTAIELALLASGIRKNDEVLVPAYTYIATALAVSNINAKPVFVDIRPDTLTICPRALEKKITPQSKAIIAVHIHGNPCDLEKIQNITKKYNLILIEDASHAHGAEYNGIKVGNFGVGCFSCYANKNLGCIGSGGIITTNNKNLYERSRKMIEVNDDPGIILSKRTPCRMGILEAAVLKTKLRFLDKIIAQKKELALSYSKRLSQKIRYQREEKNSSHVYRDFVILDPKRAAIQNFLENNGVQTKIRYKIPLYLTRYYAYLNYKRKDFPNAEIAYKDNLCLPISYALLKKETKYICDTIIKLLEN